MKIKPIVYSFFVVVAGLTIYRHLYIGGWLTNPYYHLNDPDIVNLFLAILEPIMILVIPAFWLSRSRLMYRILFITFLLQLLICLGFAVVIGLFVMAWKPRLM
jgi:hypothetical protein